MRLGLERQLSVERQCVFVPGMPTPGTKKERQLMGIKQPGFIEAFQRDVELADNATFHDGEGASTHTAVTSWQSFCSALGVQCLRPLDLISSSLSVKLS